MFAALVPGGSLETSILDLGDAAGLAGAQLETLFIYGPGTMSPEVLRIVGAAHARVLRFHNVASLDTAVLSETLCSNPDTQFLSLWDCNIDNARFAALLPPPNIRLLVLCGNPFTDFSRLPNLISTHRHLETIVIDGQVPMQIHRQIVREMSLARIEHPVYIQDNGDPRNPILSWANRYRRGALPHVLALHSSRLRGNTAISRFLRRDGDNAMVYRVIRFLI